MGGFSFYLVRGSFFKVCLGFFLVIGVGVFLVDFFLVFFFLIIYVVVVLEY